MNRSEFLKILGISAIAPSVLIVNEIGTTETPIEKFKPKRWPIYPNRISFGTKQGGNVAYTNFAYVKIDRDGKKYLVAVREVYINDEQICRHRFEREVKQVQDNYRIHDIKDMFGNSFQIEYDPVIHKN